MQAGQEQVDCLRLARHLFDELAAEAENRHTIRDSGLGIAQEDLPRLFERFYRADKSRSQIVPGVGLGLSLDKLIVVFYRGDGLVRKRWHSARHGSFCALAHQ